MAELSNEDIFFILLKKFNVVDEYLEALALNDDYAYSEEFFESTSIEDWFDYAFTWDETEQGHRFWDNMNDRWQNIIDHFNLRENNNV